jgi:hypothetical protein
MTSSTAHHHLLRVAVRLAIMSLGVAAGVVAALTGHRIAGATVSVINLAPALVLARLLVLGAAPRVPEVEERVHRIIQERHIDLSDACVEVREWVMTPVRKSALSATAHFVLSEVALRQLDDDCVAGLLGVLARSNAARGGSALRQTEPAVYWLAYFTPAVGAGVGLAFSFWLGIGGGVAGWVVGYATLSLLNGHVSRRFDRQWAEQAGGDRMWADILTAMSEAASDTRRRLRGSWPLSWILAYIVHIPGERAVAARIRALRGEVPHR